MRLSDFRLHQNHPNPFNPSTSIRYELPTASRVRLVVFDILGRRVAVLVDDMQPPGEHAVNFDASMLPSGVYVYRMEAGEHRAERRMILVK